MYLQNLWKRHKTTFIFCLLCVAAWAFFAHGYAFLNFHPSHDSLDGLHLTYPNSDDIHKVELGRMFFPIYCKIFRGMFSIPFLSGMNTILWIALSAFLVIVSLNIQAFLSRIIVCGIMTVNITVTALVATYGHDLDANMFSMLMACTAFFLWRQKWKPGILFMPAAIAISLGLYQSYICVTVALIFIALIKDLLDTKPAESVITDGLKAIVFLVLGGILYYICLRVILYHTNISLASGSSNSLTQLSSLSPQKLPDLISQLYANWWEYFAQPKTFFFEDDVISRINMLLFSIGTIILAAILFRKKLNLLQKLLLLLMVVLFPLVSNAVYILSIGNVHDLMQYAFIFAYLLIITFADHIVAENPFRQIRSMKCIPYICSGLMFLFLWGGIQTANTAYHKKELISRATQSRITEVFHEMCLEGYSRQMPLMIEGYLPLNVMPGFENVSRITGMFTNDSITTDKKSLKSYFRYILGETINVCDSEQAARIRNDPRYQEMETYPTYGYIRIIDDVMVVRLM